jgi:glucose 1-dehydrogenase
MAETAPQIDLAGKRALVTGGNTGIGAAIVRTLASAGARLAVNYLILPERTEALLAELRALLAEDNSGSPIAIQADIRDEGAVIAMFEQVREAFGGLDILVNNAGVESVYAAHELPVEEWDRVLDTNLKGAFLCARQAARVMIAQGTGGVIVNNASIHDVIARLGATAYTVSKAGLSMLTRQLALEWAEYGIRVVGVSPGAIAADRSDLDEVFKHFTISEDEFLSWIPLGRLGSEADVANAVAFLASDLAAYITGHTLYIDGGYAINLVRYDQRKMGS